MSLFVSFFVGIMIEIKAYEFALPMVVMIAFQLSLAIKCMYDDINL